MRRTDDARAASCRRLKTCESALTSPRKFSQFAIRPHTHSAHSSSARARTVFTASSCKSGESREANGPTKMDSVKRWAQPD